MTKTRVKNIQSSRHVPWIWRLPFRGSFSEPRTRTFSLTRDLIAGVERSRNPGRIWPSVAPLRLRVDRGHLAVAQILEAE